MSILSEAQRIKANIENAYVALSNKGAAIPEEQNSANLAETILGIKSEGGTNVLLTPIYVAAYKESATSAITARAVAYVKINTKGKTSLKISGKYAKQRGGCTINIRILSNISANTGSAVLTEGGNVDNNVCTVAASSSGTALSEGTYSYEFNVSGYDEVFVKIMASWGGLSGNAYYGNAFLSVEDIIIS